MLHVLPEKMCGKLKHVCTLEISRCINLREQTSSLEGLSIFVVAGVRHDADLRKSISRNLL